MGKPSRYWELIKILPSGEGCGYKVQILPPAKSYFLQEFPTLANKPNILDQTIQNRLLALLPSPNYPSSEICLRCYISHFILLSCIQRAKLFSAGGRINYRDLLPFVLNDDGIAPKGKYIPFACEILFEFHPESKCSLARWIDLKVKRHKELNKYLLEFDIEIRTAWAILNKAGKSHLDNQQDKEILAAFHVVYRWDRPQQHCQKCTGKCPQPTPAQLETMIYHLQKLGISINSSDKMLDELERIAKLLRQQNIWGKTRHITQQEHRDEWELIIDPTSTEDLAIKFEQQELQDFCQQQLFECLDKVIKQAINDHIAKQSKSRGYASLVHLIKPILREIYLSGKTQTEIARKLDINQITISRLVNPTNLVKTIRRQTLDILLNQVLEKAKQLGYTQSPVEPDYFDNLVQQLELYIDILIFREAIAELRTSRQSAMQSIYAQRLCVLLNQ